MKPLLILVLTSLAFSAAYADEKAPTPNDPKNAEMMKAWQEASTPGPQHEMLKTLVGKWKVNTKAWQSEGSKPEESAGISNFKSILGGHFVQQDFKGKMNGMPYEGTGMMGYNNVTKKFESSWYDSMSTAAMNFEGTFDETSKTITQSGDFECPLRKTTQKMRSEMKMTDRNSFTFTLFMPDMITGKEMKGMEQVYKRKK